MRGKYERTPEHRANLIAAMKRMSLTPYERTPEHRALMSTRVSAAMLMPEEYQRRSDSMRDRMRTHGHAGQQGKSPTYISWHCMLGRCYRHRVNAFKHYGGRRCECCGGDNPITVCDAWRESFAAFLDDVGERPEGTTIDRYPNRMGNYEPGNVRWATPKEQRANRGR